MTHFKQEEWVDFVNQVLSAGKQIAMQKHLETGCKQCSDTVALWQKLRVTAAAEASYQPPAGSLRMAKAAFATARVSAPRKETTSVIAVLFDSLLQPAFAGTRSTATTTRQLLYRAGPYQVDVQIEAKADRNQLIITGQLLDLDHTEFLIDQIQVKISNLRGSVVHAYTNKFGEFHGELENSGDLELSFPRTEDKPVVIVVRNAMGRLLDGKS